MPFIKCAREDLLKPLQTVVGIVESRQTLPILANILIEKKQQEVRFTTTDMDIQLSTSAPVGVGDSELSTTLPASKLTALLSALSGPQAEVTLKSTAHHVVLVSGSTRVNLLPKPAEEYPHLPEVDRDQALTVPAKILKDSLQMVHFAMAQQDVRYYLNGVYLTISGNTMCAVATDGHRLACLKSSVANAPKEPIVAILPRKTVLQLLKQLPDKDEPVDMEFSASQARFKFLNIELTTKLIEGKYPDFQRVIPANNDKKFLINRDQLISALRRANVMTSEKHRGLRWVISQNNLLVQSASSEMEEGLEEDIPISYEGEELKVGFNVSYLLDALNGLSSKEICFSFSTAEGASLMTLPDDTDFIYVLMPMRI